MSVKHNVNKITSRWVNQEQFCLRKLDSTTAGFYSQSLFSLFKQPAVSVFECSKSRKTIPVNKEKKRRKNWSSKKEENETNIFSVKADDTCIGYLKPGF